MNIKGIPYGTWNQFSMKIMSMLWPHRAMPAPLPYCIRMALLLVIRPLRSQRAVNLIDCGYFEFCNILQVPVGTYSTGLPFGLCLLGRPFSEAVLLKLGFFIEQARPDERPVPQFL